MTGYAVPSRFWARGQRCLSPHNRLCHAFRDGFRLEEQQQVVSWNSRANLLADSGLTTDEIQLVIRTANAYVAGVAPLASQAKAIHQSLQSKSLLQAVAVAQLKNLDQQRDSVVAANMDQLRVDLGRDGWFKLEAFLNNIVKPTIIFVKY